MLWLSCGVVRHENEITVSTQVLNVINSLMCYALGRKKKCKTSPHDTCLVFYYILNELNLHVRKVFVNGFFYDTRSFWFR